MWSFEAHARKKGFASIAGVDEAGRGPLAGPVVSAAVMLPSDWFENGLTAVGTIAIDDSKKLAPRKREILFDRIYRDAPGVGVGVVTAEEIDRTNILQAALRSMVLAVRNLVLQPDYLLVDGLFPIPMDLPQEPIVKGDAKSISIAAASIVAKVTRDRLMECYHRQYPQYGFSSHKGYPTRAHRLAVALYGPSPIHRKTFKGVREYVE
ncbi:MULTISPECIES: ribonuclease HII [Desulfococcus]|jgi:ribonuclease HII|uniref:Ribonuclease HII n=1 Tax=Desulfococcus multivorans DSM 2059 TaxID=1121405 RepID=S7TWA9_DESML|nr:ribonuclease HII [Desulfococcus multivorans]AOY58089.1 RnhB: ribonuclease HII [Desulfococcus multivorans]AQV00448.1 ribonuclease HII [Desulfococcus multivorans]EPR41342.1 Ribonuclease HII [Desulfococcus multivorans DSM 2059]MDX9818158.1 ribonuclease HII [Desulfococcus multivorans]SJZ72335.1 RNase HII [Desulfococcus multivorans DSM 2059]